MSDIFIIDSQDKSETSKKVKTFNLQSINDWIISGQKISPKAKVLFFRLLSTMVNAGIPVLKAITILEKQEKDVLLQKLYEYLVTNIKRGTNLSISLREYSGNFSDSECSIIESGEKTGKLNSSLQQLADQTEKMNNISKKIKGAFIYPIAIISIMFAAVTVLMTMVVPKLIDIFGDKNKLPDSTKFLLTVSDFFVNYTYFMIIAIIGFIIFMNFWYKTPIGKYRIDGWLLKVPIIGMLLKKVVLSRFARVFSNMLSSGISIVESMRIVADVVGNEVYKQRILLLREDIKKGIKIGESLEDDPLFPEMLVQMIKIGEETAKLDTIIIKIADFYDDEVEQTVGNIQKLIEPIIIVFMAVVVGFIAIGILQPIMNLADMVSQ